MRAALLAFSLSLVLATGAPAQGVADGWQPARLLSAGEIPYPANSVAQGVVVLDVVVGENGEVQDAVVRADIKSLAGPAARAIRGWHFAPALRKAQPAASVVRVAVWFVLPPPCGLGAPGGPTLPPAAQVGAMQPARATRLAAPQFPQRSAFPGTVVLEARVDVRGSLKELNTVRALSGLTDAARDAAQRSAYAAGRWNGREVESSVILAYVFANPPWCWTGPRSVPPLDRR